jgi:hypothetical protein
MRRLEEIAAGLGVRVHDIEELPPDGRARRVWVSALRRAASALSAAYPRKATGLRAAAAHGAIRALRNVPSHDEIRAAYRDYSLAGFSVIHLGIYDDPERRVLSFFRELARLLDVWAARQGRRASTYQDELAAWKSGLTLAHAEGYRFSPATLAWADDQLRLVALQPDPASTPLRTVYETLTRAAP